MTTDKKGLPPWVWVGCGCVGAIATLVLIVAGLGFWGAQKARELGETMTDPEARTEKALEILDLTGTVGDNSEIESFMRPLEPCN